MAPLLFTCPNTHRRAPTGIQADVQTLRATWSKKLKVHCPHCGETHEILVRQAYINGALDDVVDRSRPTS